MHQKEALLSSLLTKIGNKSTRRTGRTHVQLRFVTTAFVQNLCPGGVRLFYSNNDTDAYNCYTDYFIIGHKLHNQHDNAKAYLASIKLSDTVGFPARIFLCVGKPYRLTTNGDVMDGVVNVAIDLLRYLQHDTEGNKVERLWLDFRFKTAGRLARLKVAPVRVAFLGISADWVPTGRRGINVTLCKCTGFTCKHAHFPLVQASAI
ncbi:hypothetical protein MRX96_004363 [Rhipicephalus microplus]